MAKRLVAGFVVFCGLGIVGAPTAGAADTQPPTAPQNVVVREEDYDFVTTSDPSTDDGDPAPAYDILLEFGGEFFTIRYAVSGTTYRGSFNSAVRAVDQAGNRSAPTPSTLAW